MLAIPISDGVLLFTGRQTLPIVSTSENTNAVVTCQDTKQRTWIIQWRKGKQATTRQVVTLRSGDSIVCMIITVYKGIVYQWQPNCDIANQAEEMSWLLASSFWHLAFFNLPPSIATFDHNMSYAWNRKPFSFSNYGTVDLRYFRRHWNKKNKVRCRKDCNGKRTSWNGNWRKAASVVQCRMLRHPYPLLLLVANFFRNWICEWKREEVTGARFFRVVIWPIANWPLVYIAMSLLVSADSESVAVSSCFTPMKEKLRKCLEVLWAVWEHLATQCQS